MRLEPLSLSWCVLQRWWWWWWCWTSRWVPPETKEKHTRGSRHVCVSSLFRRRCGCGIGCFVVLKEISINKVTWFRTLNWLRDIHHNNSHLPVEHHEALTTATNVTATSTTTTTATTVAHTTMMKEAWDADASRASGIFFILFFNLYTLLPIYPTQRQCSTQPHQCYKGTLRVVAEDDDDVNDPKWHFGHLFDFRYVFFKILRIFIN